MDAPGDNTETLHEPTPLESVLVVHPASPVQVIVPVGVPVPGETGVTVPEQVTGCPNPEGFGVQFTVVVVVAAATV
jgi:hypothetical protein